MNPPLATWFESELAQIEAVIGRNDLVVIEARRLVASEQTKTEALEELQLEVQRALEWQRTMTHPAHPEAGGVFAECSPYVLRHLKILAREALIR